MALLTKPRAVAVLAACLTLGASAQAGDPSSLEDAVKATYLYKFAPFVSWPQTAFRPDASAFVLCVSGADAVTALLPEAIAGQQVGGRPIAIHHLADTEAPAPCQILYVANSPAAAPQLGAARGKPILTVTPDDVADHGIIRLTVIDRHVRFDVDEKLAGDSGLSISSKLLSLAHAVTPAPGKF
jgi:hypothetical protein